jgi:HAD superfamily hydrolase (TIGR01509 family)
VFDLDGTLVDSEPLSDAAWRHLVGECGYTVSDEELGRLHGLSFENVHEYFAARVPLPAVSAGLTRFSQLLFENMDNGLRVFADAVATARALHALGVSLGLASASVRARVDHTIACAGLAGLFAVTVARDEVLRGKPAPDLYLAASELLAVSPVDCVAVEDTQPGIDSARAAGMKVIAVRRQPEVALHGATILADTLTAELVMGLL